MNDLIVSLTTAASLGIAGVILVAVAYRGRRGTLPRNLWVGLRTAPLMESDDAWVTGHRAAARHLFIAGAGLTVSAVAIVFLTEAAVAVVALAGCAWVLAWVFIASRIAVRAAERGEDSAG